MRQKLNLLAIAAVTGFITYESTVRPLSPAGGGGGSKLLLHGIAYFGLATVLVTYFHPTRHGIIESIILASIVGLGIELIQYNLAFRFFSFMDILANTAGASLIILDYHGFAVRKFVELEDWALRSFTDITEIWN